MHRFRFEAEIIYWRGPAPFFFAALPETEAERIRALSKQVSYGWGMIPVEARIGDVGFTTALFPKNDTYLLPLKDDVRRRAALTAGDSAAIEIAVVTARR